MAALKYWVWLTTLPGLGERAKLQLLAHFGIDTPDEDHLVAAKHSIKEIKRMIGADSLGYLSVEGLMEAIGMEEQGVCAACFNGDYPMPLPEKGIYADSKEGTSCG